VLHGCEPGSFACAVKDGDPGNPKSLGMLNYFGMAYSVCGGCRKAFRVCLVVYNVILWR
jgi:hypothetical protein